MSETPAETLDLNYDLLMGRFLLNNLPTLKPRSIRIFLCAPYNDTNLETACLYKNVFPKLREYCMSRYGLEFQVVNLNWDIETESVLLDESLLEIDKCREISIGIMFLSLIGDEYGKSILPDFIERSKYETIIKCLKEAEIECSTLESYFKLNINYLSNRYEFEHDGINLQVKERILELLKIGAKLACDKKLICNDFYNELNESVLQKLMKKAVFKNNSNEKIAYSFVRLYKSYKDEYPTQVNTLEYLRDREINYFIPAEQLYRIKVDQCDETYFKNFALYYKKTFEKAVDGIVRENSQYSYDTLNEQVLYHLNYIKLNSINEVAPRTQSIIKLLTDYVLDNTFRQPFILTGDSGSGKTSIISTLASNLFLQLAANDYSSENIPHHAVVVRFIGIDGKCEYLRYLLYSICCQLQYIKTGSLVPMNLVPTNLKELKHFFRKFLTEDWDTDFNKPKRKIILILDSLQDLKKYDYSYKFDWLPKFLNPLIKVIISVSSQSKELIERLNRKYSNRQCYGQVESLNYEQAEYMVKKLLSSKMYRLEPPQSDFIFNLIKTKNIPSLGVKIWSEEFLNWKSHTSTDECVLKDTLIKAVQYFLLKLEKKFESTLVKHLLCYLTISLSGFSEMELQDILSLDDELMKVYKAKNLIKPTDDVLRMPWLYILNILNYLRNHLLVKPLHGINIVTWKHSIFKQIISDKYLSDRKFLAHLHRTVAEYFLGIWSSPVQKPLKYQTITLPKSDDSDKQLSIGKPIIDNYEILVDRHCPIQPIQYESFHTHVKPRYNLRKLALLPYHLVNADMINEIFECVFFNIEWIYAKIRAFDLFSVLYDYDLLKSDPEVNLVCESLKMSESAIIEDPNLLFSQLIGRLLPYYQIFPKVQAFVDECDAKSSIINPLVPVGQIFESPAWLYQSTIDMGIDSIENIQLELVESDFNGQILVYKKLLNPMTKFFDMNLQDFKNEIYNGKGKIYCNKSGDFVCIIENNSKLIIRRIESGEFYGSVEFEPCEIAHVVLSSKFICFILRKIPSPLIIDLNTSTLIKTLPYPTCFCAISPDDTVIVVHSENSLNYHSIPSFDRLITLDSAEIPEKVIFANNNRKLFVLSKDTKQITYFKLILEKKIKTSEHVLQDPNIFDMMVSSDESMLIVCALYCVYVIQVKDSINIKFKINLNEVESYINLDPKLVDDSLASFNSKSQSKNTFTGFGCTRNQTVVYATMYTYLVCYDTNSGQLLRVFQSTLSANRIIKTISSRFQDLVVSLLDNGKILIWNLEAIDYKDIKFEDQRIFNSKIDACCSPQISHNSSKNSNLCLVYSRAYPDAKTLHSKRNFHSKSVVKTCCFEKNDNPFTSQIKLACLDDNGKFCFMVTDVQDFNGKKYPEEEGFYKKICSIIDLGNENRVIDEFSYVARKNSRLEINGKFLAKKNGTIDETYLIIRQVSGLNDFDAYSSENLDWTEFETCIKIMGPINSHVSKVELFDEFKLNGDSLESNLCINKTAIFASLVQECSKLYDKQVAGLIKAKRVDVHLDVYDLFQSKEKNLKVQVFSLSEFLSSEENLGGKNVFIDIRVLGDQNFFLVYSKNGFGKDDLNHFEFDLESLKFKRDIKGEKAAFIYDPHRNQVVKKFSSIFNSEIDVDRVVFSQGDFVMDNQLNLYDLKNNSLVKNFRDIWVKFDFSFVIFISNGRYFLTCTEERRKILLIRCYDSVLVASVRLADEISCFSIGENERTILIGTVNGYVWPLKLVIDLENNEAINSYIRYYRNVQEYVSPSSSSFDSKSADLKNDLKRVSHSAHAHRALKTIESKQAFLTTKISYTSSNYSKLESDFHSGLSKLSLTQISSGIRQTRSPSRACIIQ